jgi:cold shock protein
MSKGKIKKLVADRGFGFIADEEGKDMFFHRSGLEGCEFSSLTEGQDVEFEIERSAKGPRAVKVKLA